MMKSVSLLLTLVAFSASPATAGDGDGFADGLWKVRLPEGVRVEMTFNADGSGRIAAGPMTTELSWTVAQDELCVYGGVVGGVCMRLIAREDMVLGVDSNGKRFVFERAL